MKVSTLFISAVILVVGSLSLVACNKNNSTSATPGAIAPPNCINGLCTSGGQTTVPPTTKIGFYAQTSNFTWYTNNVSTLSIQGAWKSMLKEAMGVCDRDASNGGVAGCTDWYNGMHDIVIQLDGSTASSVKVTIRSFPYVNPYYSYSYSFPDVEDFFLGLVGFPTVGNPSGFFNPMILNASIWPINNSQGFEIRSLGPQGSYGWNKYLQLQVTSGKIEDASFQYQLYWNGAVAASGTMIRCQTQTCGL